MTTLRKRRITLVALAALMLCGMAAQWIGDELSPFMNRYILRHYEGLDTAYLLLSGLWILLFVFVLILSALRLRSGRKVAAAWVVAALLFRGPALVDHIQGNEGAFRLRQLPAPAGMPVILRSDRAFSRIVRVEIPVALRVTNRAVGLREMHGIGCLHPFDDAPRLPWFVLREGKPVPVTEYTVGLRTLRPLRSRDYVVYVPHSFVESSGKPDPTMQSLLGPCLERMRELGCDSLSVESLHALEREAPGAARYLLRGDSLYVSAAGHEGWNRYGVLPLSPEAACGTVSPRNTATGCCAAGHPASTAVGAASGPGTTATDASPTRSATVASRGRVPRDDKSHRQP